MSYTEEVSEVKRGKKKYKITKKVYETGNRRRATMRSEYIKKDKFLAGIKIPDSFMCSECDKEIIGNFVFVTLTERELVSLIRVEKPIFHHDCLTYSQAEPIIGILPLVEERNAFLQRQRTPKVETEPETEVEKVEEPVVDKKTTRKQTKKTTKKSKGK